MYQRGLHRSALAPVYTPAVLGQPQRLLCATAAPPLSIAAGGEPWRRPAPTDVVGPAKFKPTRRAAVT